MVTPADLASFKCPACGNAIAYTSVMTRLLGSKDHGQVHALSTPYCQCEGFPGVPMLFVPPPPQPAPGR